MKKNLFEIYLTQEYVDDKNWLELFFKISKINGILKPWNLWIYIEKNYIRYFVETKRILPPILGGLGDFLFKKSDLKIKKNSSLNMPYILTSYCKTVIDVYDKNESKKAQKLEYVKITFYPYKYNNYLSTTKLYLQTETGKSIRKKVFFNFSIHEFVSIDFRIHTRFLYKKENTRYLDCKEVINLLDSDKEQSILKANLFPYLRDDLYLSHNTYDFDKHSVVIGASRYRKV